MTPRTCNNYPGNVAWFGERVVSVGLPAANGPAGAMRYTSSGRIAEVVLRPLTAAERRAHAL